MSNKKSEHSEALTERLRIKQLREETRELSDEQSKAIAGGRSQLELSDAQLEALSFRNAERIVRIIGFEN
jgi:hypothetical protein